MAGSASTSSSIGAGAAWAVAAVALLACVAGIGNQFAQDDIHLILGNARIQDLSSLGTLLTSSYWPPPYSQDLYRPLASLLLALQYAVGGDDPLLFRVVSYALYAASAVALFALARDLLPRRIALGVALLFAAHPVHVEAIALAVGQNEIVVALIAILMTRHYLRARRGTGLRVRDWAWLSLGYAAACLFKEQGFVIPALLIASEILVERQPASQRLRGLWMGYLALALLGVGLLAMRRAVLGDVAGSFVAEALVGLDAGERVVTMLQVVPQWLRLLAWPAMLQLDYSPQEIVASTGIGAAEALGIGLVAGAAGLAWFARRRAPVLTFGIGWCALALLPVSNVIIPSGIVLAERTLFLPSVGFVLAAGGIVAWVAPALAARGAVGRREWAAALAVLLVLGLARSIERQRVWRNDGFLAIRTVQDAPRSYRAHLGSGDVFVEIGRLNEAEASYRRAAELAPEFERWRVHLGAARVLREKGLRELEARHLEASLGMRPDQEDTRGNLAVAYLALGRYADAAAQADSALTRGGNAEVFRELRALADSAARVAAPAGAIQVRLRLGDYRPVR